MTYGYDNAGLSSVTNPWGSQVSYTHDHTGAVTGVTGAGPVSASNYASGMEYRAFGGLKAMNYGDTRQLSVSYDTRMRPVQWDVAGLLGSEYRYDYFNEHTGRVTFARNLYDTTLDRSYEYDQAARLSWTFTGAEASAHAINGQWGTQNGPYAQANFYDVHGNITQRLGWGAANASFTASYTNNRRDGFSYDLAGNLTNDVGQAFTYDATGQQATAGYAGYALSQEYDGDSLRVKKTENGATLYSLRSSVLGGQVVAEVGYYGGGWGWWRGYVQLGGQLLAVQQDGVVRWVHEDPVTKTKRMTDAGGAAISTVVFDPWGGDVGGGWSQNVGQQRRRFTTYERDGNESDEAMMRRYNRWQSRFDQPDPYGGSYDFTNPQSFNRYAYTQNDPVNFVDPSGLNLALPGGSSSSYCYFVSWVNDGVSTFVGGHCTMIGGGFTGDPGGSEPGGTETQPEETTTSNDQGLETCVAKVIGKYLGREALTLLKQSALNAGIGLSVLAGRFFIGHAIGGTIAAGTLTEIGIAIGIRMDHLSRGIAFVGGAIWAGAKLYPKLVRESFNNKKDAVRDLKACYD